MPTIPGDLARHVHRWLWPAIGLAALAAFAWHAVAHLRELQATKIAEARAWDIKGPACPALPPEDFLSGRKITPRSFSYQQVAYTRRSGYVDCASIYYEGGRSDRFFPVCQFTSPGHLMVRTAKGVWYFNPGPGQPATVSTQDDQPRCVMASNVTLKTVRDRRAASQ